MSETPRLQLTSVTIGAPDPRALADFYARLLATTVHASEPAGPGEPAEAGWAQFKATHDRGSLTVNVEYEAAWQPPVWPARKGQPPVWPARKGQPVATQHLDIDVEDLEAATGWAVECGASLAEHQPQQEVRVLFDPAGHPFCLFTEAG